MGWEMSFEEFQDGHHGGQFGYLNGKDFSNSESLCHCDASNQVFGSTQLMVWEEMSFELFQDGVQLGYGNKMILAILSLYNSPKPPIKFQFNLTYCLGLDVV